MISTGSKGELSTARPIAGKNKKKLFDELNLYHSKKSDIPSHAPCKVGKFPWVCTLDVAKFNCRPNAHGWKNQKWK